MKSQPSTERVLTCKEMYAVDQAAAQRGQSTFELMKAAGAAVASVAERMLPRGGRTVVICGPGNNGGDGFVAASILSQRGYDVQLGLWGDHDELKGDARAAKDLWFGALSPLDSKLIEAADLIIDALFGAGLTRPIASDSAVARLFDVIESRQIPVLAVDFPSGLNGDTGAAHGHVLPAERTVTFCRRKPAHLLFPGRRLCGETTVVDIGIGDDTVGSVDGQLYRNHPSVWCGDFPALSEVGHKYQRGHVIVLTGPVEMAGAGRLAAVGALRIGAGVVTVAGPRETVHSGSSVPLALLHAVLNDPMDLKSLLEDQRKNVIVLGPGLGVNENAHRLIEIALMSNRPVVLDADGITLASAKRNEFFNAIAADESRPVVLTPHEGEFRRIFPDVAGSRIELARAAAELSRAIVILKGPDTIIAAPDGRCTINDNAPPWLATAGAGDVLAGFVGGLLAQGMPAWEAACAAVWIHSACAASLGRGMIADDIPNQVPTVFAQNLF